MKKNKKINNKGFILAETLIATLFVAVIFSVILINFYPMIGEYEKRENYDDVDSKYGAYWVKTLIEDSDFNIEKPAAGAAPLSVTQNRGITCGVLYPSDNQKKQRCSDLFTRLDITTVLITKYNVKEFKEVVNKKKYNTSIFSSELVDYINYLPNYDKYPSLYGAKYRVIVEFRRVYNDPMKPGSQSFYKTFATMEVNR